ncbi:MAG: STAS domain-containing protein [Pseudomonadota bacterium]
MTAQQGGTWQVTEALTMDNVHGALSAAQVFFNQHAALVVDLGAVPEVDSSALAVMFEWLRQAQRRNVELKFANLPDNLQSLARLYGVTDLIPVLDSAS